MAKRPTDETPPELGQGTVDEGAAALDAIFPDAGDEPAEGKEEQPERKAPPEPEKERPEGDAPPAFEDELDSILGLETVPDPEPKPEGDGSEDAGEDGGDATYLVVNADGTEERVTREELRNRTLRQRDYTQKTQKLAEDRRALESLREEVGKTREKYLAELKEVEAMTGDPAEPDWEQVEREHPEEYLALRDRWTRHREARERIRNRRKQLEDETAADRRRKYEEYVAAERGKLLHAMPELRQAEKAREVFNDLQEVGRQYGFTTDEMSSWPDHRVWLLLRDAQRLHRIASRRKELRQPKGKTKPLTPGARRNTDGAVKSRQQREAVDRLLHSGSTDDAAAALTAFGM